MSCKIHKTGNEFEDLKVAHKQTTWEVAKKYHKQVDMVDTLGKLGFLVVGCTSRAHTQYKWRLAKDWMRPTKRA